MTCHVTQDLNKYNSELEKQVKEENSNYYWLVETKQWEEWTYTKSELIKEVKLAHKNKLKVRVRRFNDFND